MFYIFIKKDETKPQASTPAAAAKKEN